MCDWIRSYWPDNIECTFFKNFCSSLREKCADCFTKFLPEFRAICKQCQTFGLTKYKQCQAKYKLCRNKCCRGFNDSVDRVAMNWNKLNTNHHFLHCIPLKVGIVVIALLGLLYGAFGLYCCVTITMGHNKWRHVYKDKLDLLASMYLLSIFTGLLVVPYISLTLGIIIKSPVPILFYLYCIVFHLLCVWTITFGVSAYCIFINQKCSMGSGQGQAVSAIVLAMFYTFVWVYIIYCVNSYRKLRSGIIDVKVPVAVPAKTPARAAGAVPTLPPARPLATVPGAPAPPARVPASPQTSPQATRPTSTAQPPSRPLTKVAAKPSKNVLSAKLS